jgi:imidazolonepropionase-like amidohydrolase
MRPVVHTSLAAETIEAVDAGAALLMHTPFRDELSDEQAAHIAKAGVPFVTTVRIFGARIAASKGETRKFDAEMVDLAVLTAFKERPADYDDGVFADMRKNFTNYDKFARANFKKLLAAGATFFVGTDSGTAGSFPGAALHGELEVLAELGAPPLRILAAATSVPATWLEPAGGFGRVAAGKRADLILVRGDPSADITSLDALEEVFLEGDRLIRKR